MPMKRCPVCSEWYHHLSTDVDYVHKCRKADGTRMTADNEQWKIPNRQNMKFFTGSWNTRGENPKLPRREKSRSDIIDNIYEDIEVSTFINLDE